MDVCSIWGLFNYVNFRVSASIDKLDSLFSYASLGDNNKYTPDVQSTLSTHQATVSSQNGQLLSGQHNSGSLHAQLTNGHLSPNSSNHDLLTNSSSSNATVNTTASNLPHFLNTNTTQQSMNPINCLSGYFPHSSISQNPLMTDPSMHYYGPPHSNPFASQFQTNSYLNQQNMMGKFYKQTKRNYGCNCRSTTSTASINAYNKSRFVQARYFTRSYRRAFMFKHSHNRKGLSIKCVFSWFCWWSVFILIILFLIYFNHLIIWHPI